MGKSAIINRAFSIAFCMFTRMGTIFQVMKVDQGTMLLIHSHVNFRHGSFRHPVSNAMALHQDMTNFSNENQVITELIGYISLYVSWIVGNVPICTVWLCIFSYGFLLSMLVIIRHVWSNTVSILSCRYHWTFRSGLKSYGSPFSLLWAKDLRSYYTRVVLSHDSKDSTFEHEYPCLLAMTSRAIVFELTETAFPSFFAAASHELRAGWLLQGQEDIT